MELFSIKCCLLKYQSVGQLQLSSGRVLATTTAMELRVYRAMTTAMQQQKQHGCRAVLFLFPAVLFYSSFLQCCFIPLACKAVLFLFPAGLFYSSFLQGCFIPLSCSAVLFLLPARLEQQNRHGCSAVLFLFPAVLFYSFFLQMSMSVRIMFSSACHRQNSLVTRR